MNNWEKTTLGEVCDTISTTYKKKDEKIVLINTSDVLNGKVLNHEYVQNVDIKGQFKKTFIKDDILYSEIRPQNRRYAYIDFDSNNYVASTKLMVLRYKENVLPKFLYIILSSNNVINNLQAIAETRSGTFPQITYTELSKIIINLPPLDEQKRIADVLSALDDKIEINNKINENLEAQAQAIFKQWFVDFEFPDEEGKPYKSNGGKFIDSELGEIPEGWRLGSIGDYCKVRSGFAFKSSWWLDDNFKEDKVKVIKIKCIDNSQINLNDCSFVSSDKCELAREFLVNEGDLVIAMTGATLGKFAIIPKLDEKLLVNQRVGKFFLGVKPIEKMPFLHLTLKQDRVYNEIVNKGQGSAQPNISSSDIENVEIVFPNEEILCDFNSKMNYLYQLLSNNKNENQKLSELRDSLLPRLMSGEVRV